MRSIRWIYQERESTEPWALYIEREWVYRKPRDAIYTLRLYSERVPDSSYFVEMRQGRLTKAKAIMWIGWQLTDIYGECNPDDIKQLQAEFNYFTFAKEN